MAKKMSGLGRGIDAIFLENTVETEEKKGGVMTLRVSQMEPKGNQPRKYFDTEALSQLAESISVHGVLQPILVRELGGDRYQIIAGERRWRASKMAGVSEVPVVLLDKTEAEAAQIALIENIQREDLNPIEEAAAYRALAEEYQLTQEEISRRAGISQSAVANKLRLLQLSHAEQQKVLLYGLSERHARALLRLKSPEMRYCALEAVCKKKLSVAATEALIESYLAQEDKRSHIYRQEEPPSPGISRFEERKCSKFVLHTLQPLYNSLEKTLNIFRKTGREAILESKQTPNGLFITIKIPNP